ncbi:MAG: sensor domain-containing protein [Actinobacteria bacterium]|nr:sensor domain-containing protein [Actinomycetota bacterium]MBU1494203.1 sensor domain-containing protein [Actinomycetota bacterium]
MDGFFTPLIRARTYRRLFYLLLGLPFGIFYFVFLVTAVSVGVGLVIIWVGVLILVFAVAAWRGMGHFERGFANSMLGGSIEAPQPLVVGRDDQGRRTQWTRVKAMLADSYTYRSFFWLLLRFPFGIAGFVIGVTGTSLALGLVAAPVALAFPDWSTRIDGVSRVLDGLEWLAVIVPLLGLLVAAVTAHVVNGFAEVHLMVAGSLLGPGARREVQVQRRRAQVAEERTRLAHELHDSVGHTLTMMVVQAGAGAHVYDRDPEFSRRALGNIETSGRQALEELDRILGILRDDDAAERSPQPGLDQVAQLVGDLAEAGLGVDLIVDGSLDGLPLDVSRSGYRIIQESLTNVMKHAGPVPTTVSVHRGAGVVEIEVLNGPPAGGGTTFAPAESGGRGLIGIEERTAMLGGSVEAGPRPGGGFRVWARLPLEGGA